MPEIVFAQEYNRIDFSPPMPVLDIGVSRPGALAPVITLEAVVDTGADGTLLPIDCLERVEAPYVDRVYLMGITGTREVVDLFIVTLFIGKQLIRGVRAVALPSGSTSILGRDVLNQMRVHLDGPATMSEVYK